MLGAPVSRTLCLLVVATALVPSVHAQEHPGMWTELVSDQANDVKAQSSVGPVPVSERAVDVRTVRIQEWADSYVFEFRSGEDGGLGATSIRSVFAFAFHDVSSGAVRQVEFRSEGQSATIHIDGQAVTEGPMSWTGHAYHYDLKIGRNVLSGDDSWGIGDRIFNTYATLENPTAEPFSTSDRGPDSGYGAEYVSQDDASGHEQQHGQGESSLVGWKTATGPEFAAGPSIAVDAADGIHVAYIVYNDDRDVAKGLYHGIVEGDRIPSTRVADAVMPAEIHQDRKTATAIDVDEQGGVHIVYYPHPNGTAADEVRYARRSGEAWTIEDPAKLSDGNVLAVEDGYRSIPSVLAAQGKVYVAFQKSLDQYAIVERGGSDKWKLVSEGSGRFVRLDLDDQGRLHAAWFVPIEDGYPNRGVSGDLMYQQVGSGVAPKLIAQKIIEQTRFWEGSETDGSFAFALDGMDRPTFVWEDERERHFGVLKGSDLGVSDSPLTPSHGNPQLRMRMVYDQDGNAHIASGYGGSDLYALRTSDGSWAMQDIYRHDMFSLDVLSDGRAVLSHTQPHGGTTLAVLTADRRPGSSEIVEADERPDEPAAFPGTPVIPGPGLAVGIIGGLGGLSWVWLRGVDRAPRLLGATVALIAGFSRLKKNELLDHESREEIVEAILSAPGRTAADVRKALGISRTTFFYHLRRLEQEGLVRVSRQGAQVYLHAPTYGSNVPGPATIEARIFRAAQDAPGMAARDYAIMLQLHERTVRHHLLSLERRGQIRSERQSARAVHWFGGAGRGQN